MSKQIMALPAQDGHALLISGYRRALGFIVPYWPRLALVLVTGVAATSFGLSQPYISKLLIDDALLKRDFRTLMIVSGLMILATVGRFALKILSSYQCVRIPALVLFDMRLALYRHLQRLSLLARTRLGDY
jgi:ATP-binding cassette subfamily B protein